jgi:hypothetical protein
MKTKKFPTKFYKSKVKNETTFGFLLPYFIQKKLSANNATMPKTMMKI